ncbi:MAG TPA: Clp1/GlmU family protein [Thermodesulfobacteriota bacterium]|nr:Clp1/GlmU family protein [Thermodesulfobacteriota bacterium]
MNIHLPPEWKKIDIPPLSGILMIVGGPDTGKTTFARHLFTELCRVFPRVAYLDGDPGQTQLGPPGTMTLSLNREGEAVFPPRGPVWRSFTGSTSPRGHQVSFLLGAARLARKAFQRRVRAIVYDTSGFVSASGGGTNLKWAKIELLRPRFLFAVQRGHEIEPLLRPIRLTHRVQLVELASSPLSVRRDAEARRRHRVKKYEEYFSGAGPLTIPLSGLAVFPGPLFDPGRLAALEDAGGFTLGVGVVEACSPDREEAVLRTPLSSVRNVDCLRIGDVSLDLQTCRDKLILPGGRPEPGERRGPGDAPA